MRLALVVGLMTGLAGAAAAQDASVDSRKAETVRKLESQRVTLDFKDTPLDDVVNFLRDLTGLNFHIDSDIGTKLSPEQLRVTFRAKDLTLKSALKLILSARDLTAVWREGVLVIQHKDKSAAAVSMEMYDVRDLLLKIGDFPGPKVELAQGDKAKVGAQFFLADEERKPPIDAELIQELVKSSTGDRSWEENPATSVQLANGMLVVTQSKKVREEVRRLLDRLRQYK